jgi:hypothetical protein
MMPQVSSFRERRQDGSATRVAVTITGDVSPADVEETPGRSRTESLRQSCPTM